MGVFKIDALVVGAGFGGIYQLKKLLDLKLSVKVIDAADDVGGTWYWNRYPGAMSDTESFLYRYSWDVEDLKSYPWNRHYLQGPEILEYLEHVVERNNLRKHFQFNTELIGATWSDAEERWIVETSVGDTFKSRYLVTALGLLSKSNIPNIPGIDSFKGQLHHTGRWPKGLDIRGKKVGVIGNGSTGTQVITAVAKEVETLVCFQRTPQYSVPSGDREVAPGYRDDLNQKYTEVWKDAKNTMFAFGFQESDRPTFSVDEAEREKIFESAWQKGGGFRFMFETFCDISYDEAANNAAADFIRKKISEIVKDPETARKLTPTDYYARRPLCDSGYYEQFNRPNVKLVDLKETSISQVVPQGVKLENGEVHELDLLVFATGFDAVDGNYSRIAIKGRDGRSLKDHWTAAGPVSYLGISVPDFPNMFMVLGPNGPFTNLPPTIETQVEFITDLIEIAELSRSRPTLNGESKSLSTSNATADAVNGTPGYGPEVIEATKEAEEEWTELCDKLSSGSLFRKTDSWIFGANIPGKKPAVMFFFGGLANYRSKLQEILANNLQGFVRRGQGKGLAAPSNAPVTQSVAVGS
ncbi:cyclohexanone monooxygenase [Exophiala aquamarina CBS 119918]|uniref:Cyclohexanone monooxygenase n=1 Tax=Exophiala aquamarina CBS 119918 TaxID=1182545 RepID=A0A072P9W9_9EURO|nr:cyclohexanone monooxygenase [Exophiala aquamarina CBS 119918]KEF52330.1 cyclohexanone monooxygenase [Exophiala aquamarina CBS 119918]